MQGKLYGIGVGPGNPELLTIAAVKRITATPVIAVPESGGKEQVALKIAREYIAGKEILSLNMPMTRDKQQLQIYHEKAAESLCKWLDKGMDVAFLTLGDPSIYSTYLYLHELVLLKGYEAEMIPGIPSFCSGAAKLNEGLCIGNENLHIIASSHDDGEEALKLSGTKVFMKAGKKNQELIQLLNEKGLADQASLVERCDMPGQKVVKGLAGYQETSSYFSLIILKDEETEAGEPGILPENEISSSHYPLFIEMKNRKVVIFGGGQIAERRAKSLLAFGADLTLIAPAITNGLSELINKKQLCWLKKEYEASDFTDASLAIAATNNRSLNQQIWQAGKDRGILVNVCDKKEEGDFWFSALVKNNGLLAGIVSETGNHKRVADFAERLRLLPEETK